MRPLNPTQSAPARPPSITASLATGAPQLVTDLGGLQDIKRLDKDQGLHQVAQQFESLFVQMLFKNMRQAQSAFDNPELGNSQGESLYRDLYDQQMALNIARGRGLGIAKAVYQQLSKNAGLANADRADRQEPTRGHSMQALPARAPLGPVTVAPVTVASMSPTPTQPELSQNDWDALFARYFGDAVPVTAASVASEDQTASAAAKAVAANDVSASAPAAGAASPSTLARALALFESQSHRDPKAAGAPTVLGRLQEAFVGRLLPSVRAVAGRLGVDPLMLIAQAALETGWGRHMVQGSNNLFNIKADSRWQGPAVATQTLEYYQGRPVKETAQFRRYPSLMHSLDDYARFISQSPRYADALRQAADSEAYITGLQQAGYATDPAYADKIQQIYRQLKHHFTEASDPIF